MSAGGCGWPTRSKRLIRWWPRWPVAAGCRGRHWQSQLGVTRSAVSARIGRLRRAGIDVYAVSGKGYRLAGGVDLLDAAAVRAGLAPAIAPCSIS